MILGFASASCHTVSLDKKFLQWLFLPRESCQNPNRLLAEEGGGGGWEVTLQWTGTPSEGVVVLVVS